MQSRRTRAQLNRAIRQEALREQLSKAAHAQRANDCIEKIKGAEDRLALNKWVAAFNAHMRLLDKYLPNMTIVQVEDDHETRTNPDQYTDEQLIAIATSSGANGAGAAGSQGKLH